MGLFYGYSACLLWSSSVFISLTFCDPAGPAHSKGARFGRNRSIAPFV